MSEEYSVGTSTETARRGRDPRILGLVEGDASSAITLSGIPRFLFEALGRRFPFVECLDYAPAGVKRFTLAAATFRPSRAVWRARLHTSLRAHRALTQTLTTRLAQVDAGFDLALQVFGWVAGQPRPYVLYIDQTRLMAERGFPQWLPLMPRERSQVLELERRMYHDAHHVFVMGNPARESLMCDYEVDPSQVTVVGGGINFETVPDPTGPAREPTILFVGRDLERKGGRCLLRAFERVRMELPEAVLHVVGVSERLNRPGVITHDGRLFDHRRRLSDLYASARVFCLPSLYEPFGLVLPEAMAHAVPCIGSDVQAIPEILDGGRAGLIVPAGEPEPLADAILRLLTDDELARRVGLAGRRRVEHNYTWDHVVKRMAPVLAQVGGAGR